MPTARSLRVRPSAARGPPHGPPPSCCHCARLRGAGKLGHDGLSHRCPGSTPESDQSAGEKGTVAGGGCEGDALRPPRHRAFCRGAGGLAGIFGAV